MKTRTLYSRRNARRERTLRRCEAMRAAKERKREARVAAARQLGYDVELKATDKGLEVYYIRPVPPCPDIIKERSGDAKASK